MIGRDGRLRPGDLYVPNVALLLTELHPETNPVYFTGKYVKMQLGSRSSTDRAGVS